MATGSKTSCFKAGQKLGNWRLELGCAVEGFVCGNIVNTAIIYYNKRDEYV